MINSYRSSNVEPNYLTIIIIVAYTVFFHCPAHSFPMSLDFRGQSRYRDVTRGYIITCSMCKASPHAHVVSPLKSPHCFLYPLLQVFEVQTPLVMSYPLAGSSFRVTMPKCDVSIVLLVTLYDFCREVACFTLGRKPFIDFRRLF